MRAIPSLLAAAFLSATLAPAQGQNLRYPETRKGEVADDYHGTKVADPYRWLEDLDSEETGAWVKAQNEITFSFLEKIPERYQIRSRLTERWDYPKYGVPIKKGERYFFFKNDGLQNHSVLYAQESLDAPPRVVIDPNTFSEDGTVALSNLVISNDGRWAAYGTSSGGSDWVTVRVRDIETGQDLADELSWIKFIPPAWTEDATGLFYCRYDEPAEGEAYEQPNRFMKLYYHRIGTPQDDDVLVYERPENADLGFDIHVSNDGRYLVIAVWQGTDRRNDIHYIDLERTPHVVIPLFDRFDAAYKFIGNTGTEWYFLTDLEAPNKRLVAVDIENRAPHRWRELIAESAAVLDTVAVIADRLIALALMDVKARLSIHELTGGRLVEEIELPTLGSVWHLSGRRDDTEMFYSFTSFACPTTIYRYDFTTAQSTIFRAPEIDFDASQYETKQVFYEGKDGTRIPMFIAHKKGIQMDGSNPTYLYAYGGFNNNMTPGFSISNLEWMEMGGIFAMPNLRGGGEYGETWHEAGMLDKKQTVFDDFIAAAEYLIAEGYTSTPKLAIAGGSNGGLLTGACILQRPDLFGASIVAVGVLDMLRFHKFTIGWAWVSEYGSSDDPEQFEYLYQYSPLHNVRPGTHYPATLIMTADHDDRVVPSHSFKFAATLQAAQTGPNPILIRIETKAGHSAGKPTSKRIEEQTDKWAFLLRVLGEEGSFESQEPGSN